MMFILSSCVWGQVWQHPNLPYGFAGSDKGVSNQKKGIEYERIIVIQNNDTVHSELSFYDSLGRQNKRIFRGDTVVYQYNIDGVLIGKESSRGLESKILKHNAKGQLTNLVTIQNMDTIENVNYLYNGAAELPNIIFYQNGNREERSYYENGKLKNVLFYDQSRLSDSLNYIHLIDTVKYSDCYLNSTNGNWICEKVTGIFDDSNRIVKIITEIPNGKEFVLSTLEYQYNQNGKVNKISDSLSNGSYGESINYYDKEGFLTKAEFYSEGQKVKTMLFINIEYK